MSKRFRGALILDWDLQLPNFAAPGVLLRVGVLANLCMLAGAIIKQDRFMEPYDSFVAAAAIGEPALVLTMLILSLAWRRCSPKMRSFLALFTGAAAVGSLSLIKPGVNWADAARSGVNAMIVSLVLCLYFDWRYRRLSPAVAEAKLEALVSRMRPHFLFNAINGIVMLLNKSPSDAEEALLDLSDVFRALLKESNGMARLADEVALTEKYLRIEKMRFRERMQVNISLDAKCGNVLIPTMLLQPLAENAVIHGIETMGSGAIDITAFVKDGRLFLVVENPYVKDRPKTTMRSSNGMAMDNIKQRLDLIYDIDSKFTAGPRGDSTWRVSIQVPAHEQQAVKEHPMLR
jgi:two-component system sensor histidine kinase AlgZ